MIYRKQRAEIGFADSMTTILTWEEAWKSAHEGWGLSIVGSFGRGRYRKKCLPSNWVFLKQPFPCGYMSWGRFKRSENGFRINSTIDRWSQNTCQILLARQKRKSFLHRIVTGDEKWIYFQNPKRKKSWVDPAQPSTSSSRSNRFGWKMMLCVRWDQEGVIYYELLKPGETVNAHRYQQLIKLHRALREKRPHYRKRHDKLIFLHDNAPSPTSTMVQNYLETLNWEVLPHPAYSPDLASSDYHLFSSMGHALLSGTSILTKTSENGLMSGLPRKMKNFFGVVYTNCPKDGKNV